MKLAKEAMFMARAMKDAGQLDYARFFLQIANRYVRYALLLKYSHN